MDRHSNKGEKKGGSVNRPDNTSEGDNLGVDTVEWSVRERVVDSTENIPEWEGRRKKGTSFLLSFYPDVAPTI